MNSEVVVSHCVTCSIQRGNASAVPRIGCLLHVVFHNDDVKGKQLDILRAAYM